MRTKNPALNAEVMSGVQGLAVGQGMSIQGAVNKTAILLCLALIASSWVWGRAMAGGPVQGYLALGVFGGFVVALGTVFAPSWAPITAPLYAALEGLALGGLSAAFEQRYPGIAIQAVALTFGTMAAMLLAYTLRLIRVSAKLRMGIIAATGGICLVYLASWILGWFGVQIPLLYDASPLGIGISLVIVAVAALNLVLDFDLIEQGARNGLPKAMEWYAAFALMVTLVWLYLEMLRLLARVRRR